MAEEEDFGKIAYETYRQFVGGRSVNNQEIPPWEAQSDNLREAWTEAANAVLDEYEAPKGKSESSSKGKKS